MKNSLALIVQKLLSKNKIIYDKKELDFQIQSHPSYPSLHAITGVLDHFNIENIAAEVPTDKETLHQLPDSFIAQITTDNGNDLVTVSKVNNKPFYRLLSGEEKEKKLSESEFLTRFTGIIVAIEKTNKETVTTISNLKNTVFLVLFAALAFTLFITKNTVLVNYIYITLSILGGIASYTILKQELGQSTAIGNAFCSGNNDKKDCDAVLSSKGAEIIKGHKLSDLSIIYFSSLVVASFFLNTINTLLVINLIALPITLYSIYYQAKIVKTWCMLCLSIVGILWLQAGTLFFNFQGVENLINLNISNVLITITSFVGTYVTWTFLKPLVSELNQLQKEKIEFVKFKRNFNLFNSLLQKSPTLNTTIEDSKEIVLGNKNANLEIVVITNPFCGHCKPVHKIVNDIFKKHSETVKIIVRFNVPVDHPESNGVIVSSKLIELYNENDTKTALEAMDQIYDGMDYDKWLTKWGASKNEKTYLAVLENEKEWCNENTINFTPEILINGRSFPKEYQRTDLTYFIEDLEENLQNSLQYNL